MSDVSRESERNEQPGEGCALFRELISASLDGELSASEQDDLATHLSGCAGCRAHRARLQRLRPLLREASPLVPVGAEALVALAARLRDEPATAAESGRVVRYDWLAVRFQLLKVAAVVAFVTGASWLLVQQLGTPERVIVHVTPTPEATPIASAEPVPAPSVGPSPGPSATPGPTLAASPSPTATPSEGPLPPPPGGWPTPRASESPTPTLAASPTPTPTPSAGDTRTHDPQSDPTPAPTRRPEVELAALERLIQEARGKDTPTDQRPHVLLALAQFDYPDAYAFLGEVLGGELDSLPEPNASRRAAWGALGELGTEAAAKALLRAPRRSGPLGQTDSAHLLAALSRLGDDAGAGLVAAALGRRGVSEDDRFLLLQALGAIARPNTTEAVLAFHASRQKPWLRRESGQVLGRLGDARALPALIASLEERRAVVRQGAALGLGLLAMRAPETAREGLPALARALGDDEPAVRVAVVTGLAESGHLFAVPVLIERLDPDAEPRRDLRERVRDALARLTGQRFADADAARRWLTGGAALPGPGGPLLAVRGEEGIEDLARRGGKVVFLLDGSGSMAPAGKWALAQFELVLALEALPAQRRDRVLFNVVVFADATKPLFRRLVGSQDRGRVREAVRAVKAEQARQVAQTDLARALSAALDVGGVDTVILISDGLLDEKQDIEQVLWRVARENRRREQPVRIHAVHVRGGGRAIKLDPQPVDPDHPEDVNFMKRLARGSGGVYLRN